jgi:hypothetical protein
VGFDFSELISSFLAANGRDLRLYQPSLKGKGEIFSPARRLWACWLSLRSLPQSRENFKGSVEAEIAPQFG